MIITNPHRTDQLKAQLVALWELSVKATHDFLTDEQITNLKPFVEEGIRFIPKLIVHYTGSLPTAFMGIDGDKIEMLFVTPDFFGKGIGKTLVQYGIKSEKISYVDVNEQNPGAYHFYKRMGFTVYERSETDDQGNPFPILRLRLGNITIRKAVIEDVFEVKDLFQNTVLSVNRADYTQAEVEDWAFCGNNMDKWINAYYFIVALNQESRIIGFASISSEGYLYSMFVHKDFQRQGVASILLYDIECYGRRCKFAEIQADVSLTARPFFEKRGYQVVEEQFRRTYQLELINFKMQMDL